MFASHNTYLAPSVSGSYIYLDATLSPEMLLDMLGTDADQNTANILHIKQEMPSYKNLRIGVNLASLLPGASSTKSELVV